MKRESRRTFREATAEENARMQQLRHEIDRELPDLIQTDQLRKSAAEEDTFSGALRRAIHQHDLSLTQIAQQSCISVEELDEFLSGERMLASGVIDRLVKTLGWKLVPVENTT